MKFHGDINLQDNRIQRMVIQAETNFPTTPQAGRVVFKDKRLWICAEIVEGSPAWLPLTSQLDAFIHIQETASDEWLVDHNLNCTTPIVQVYDENYKMVFVDSIEPVSNNQTKITLGTPAAGRAIVIVGQETGANRDPRKYTHYQTTGSTTWVIKHGLGYTPLIRAFNGNDEITPASTTHDSLFQTTLTFSGIQSGYATAS